MRLVAGLLVLMFAAIACADPLCCADGCARRDVAATSQTAQHGADCPICQPGSIATMQSLSVAGFVSVGAMPLLEPSPIDSIPRVIEHPPRA